MLHLQETYRNATAGHGIGESEVYETFTDNPGELFRALRAEYGRCISKVYVDDQNAALAVGWVFEARVRYEDCDETYLREVWCTLHSAPDTVTVEHHYQALAA
jgi:hypothetical protein